MQEQDNKVSEEFVDNREWGPVISQLGRYTDAVNKEFTLVSDRMNWFVVSNSFMFSAFTTAAANFDEVQTTQLFIKAILVLMPFLGLAMAAFVIPALQAAHEAARNLKDKRDAFERRLPAHLQIELISSKDKEHSAGNRPPYWIPRILAVVWVLLLLNTMVWLCLDKVIDASDRVSKAEADLVIATDKLKSAEGKLGAAEQAMQSTVEALKKAQEEAEGKLGAAEQAMQSTAGTLKKAKEEYDALSAKASRRR